MELEPQLIAVVVLVGLAAIYVARRVVRDWSGAGKAGCGGSCGCAATGSKNRNDREKELIPLEQITIRDSHDV